MCRYSYSCPCSGSKYCPYYVPQQAKQINGRLCIGGPKHGEYLVVSPGCNRVSVPTTRGPVFVGTYEIAEMYENHVREEVYTLKTIRNIESKQATSDDGQETATVVATVEVKVLVHESILTSEECTAQYRKLKPIIARSNRTVTRAFGLLTL